MIGFRRVYADPYAPPQRGILRGVVVAVVTITAIGVGVATGLTLTKPPDQPTARPATAFAGDAAIPSPAGWLPVLAPADIPGFVPRQSVARASPDATIVVLTTFPRGPELLPSGLADLTTGAPEIVRRAAMSALRWRLDDREGMRTAVVAIPTTESTIGIACRGGSWRTLLLDCDRAFDQVRIVRGRPLPPTPDAAVVQGLIAAVRKLNAGVVPARRKLRTAPTDAARAAAAADAARAASDAAAVAELQARGRPRAHDAVGALSSLARGYDELRRGFATDSGALQRSGVARIRDAERAFDRALATWRRYIQPPRF